MPPLVAQLLAVLDRAEVRAALDQAGARPPVGDRLLAGVENPVGRKAQVRMRNQDELPVRREGAHRQVQRRLALILPVRRLKDRLVQVRLAAVEHQRVSLRHLAPESQ